jgi:hypothetical protein
MHEKLLYKNFFNVRKPAASTCFDTVRDRVCNVLTLEKRAMQEA